MSRRFVIVNGWDADGWPYGLAAAGISADSGASILLTARDSLRGPTADMVRGCGG